MSSLNQQIKNNINQQINQKIKKERKMLRSFFFVRMLYAQAALWNLVRNSRTLRTSCSFSKLSSISLMVPFT